MVNVFTMRSEKKAAGHIQPITRPTLSKLLSFKIGDTTFQDQITNRLILRLRTCKGSVGGPFFTTSMSRNSSIEVSEQNKFCQSTDIDVQKLRKSRPGSLKDIKWFRNVNRRILRLKNCEMFDRM